MTKYSHEELEAQGYISHLTHTFEFKGGLARKGHFEFAHAEGNPDFCVRSALAVARGLGLFDLPVIQEDRGNEVAYTFYFKNVFNYNLFELGVTGPKMGINQNTHNLGKDEPTGMCDAYLIATKEFCDNYEISCQLIKAEQRSFTAIFNSNVDFYAFQNAILKKDGPINRMAKVIYEASNPKTGPSQG